MNTAYAFHTHQTEPGLIEEFRGIEYYISTKMDGSSHSIGIDNEGLHVTGHNYEYKDDDSCDYYVYLKKNNYINKIQEFYVKNKLNLLTIQGEFCGPGIQSNPIKLIKPEWYVFTIRENGERVGLKRMLDICNELGIQTVPIEEVAFDLPSKYPTVESLLERAEGKYETGTIKEGIFTDTYKLDLVNVYIYP